MRGWACDLNPTEPLTLEENEEIYNRIDDVYLGISIEEEQEAIERFYGGSRQAAEEFINKQVAAITATPRRPATG